MARQEVDFERVAETIFFSQGLTEAGLLQMHGLEYRKGKGFADIKKAIQKTYKQKSHKTEMEISWLALYLRLDVFKKFQVES